MKVYGMASRIFLLFLLWELTIWLRDEGIELPKVRREKEKRPRIVNRFFHLVFSPILSLIYSHPFLLFPVLYAVGQERKRCKL